MSQHPIDLNQLGEQYSVEIKTTEGIEERASRLRREEAEAYHQRMRTSVFFYVGLLAAVVVGGYCTWAALNSDFTVDQQRFAQSIVTLLIGGVAGFLTGKNTK
jgi:hypothetical protein